MDKMFRGFETHSEVKSLSQITETHHTFRLLQLLTDGQKNVFVSLPKIPVGTAAVANGRERSSSYKILAGATLRLLHWYFGLCLIKPAKLISFPLPVQPCGTSPEMDYIMSGAKGRPVHLQTGYNEDALNIANWSQSKFCHFTIKAFK